MSAFVKELRRRPLRAILEEEGGRRSTGRQAYLVWSTARLASASYGLLSYLPR